MSAIAIYIAPYGPDSDTSTHQPTNSYSGTTDTSSPVEIVNYRLTPRYKMPKKQIDRWHDFREIQNENPPVAPQVRKGYWRRLERGRSL